MITLADLAAEVESVAAVRELASGHPPDTPVGRALRRCLAHAEEHLVAAAHDTQIDGRRVLTAAVAGPVDHLPIRVAGLIARWRTIGGGHPSVAAKIAHLEQLAATLAPLEAEEDPP